MTEVLGHASNQRARRVVEVLARAGYAARGLVCLLVGGLTVLAAVDAAGTET